MNEQQIRALIRSEINQAVPAAVQQQANASRFGMASIPFHVHNGKDAPFIKADDIIPSTSVSGRITFSQETDYTLNLNASFTPSHVSLYGIAYDVTGGTGQRCMIMGTANLGPSFYFQPGTTSSVVTGDIQYPFTDPNINGGTDVPLQSSTYLWVDNGSTTFHGQPGEGHIVDVQWDGTVYARATVTLFNRNSVIFNVSDLFTGWEIYTNIVIT